MAGNAIYQNNILTIINKEMFGDVMNKLKRIGALALVILLVLLYAVTLILAILPQQWAKEIFPGFVFASIALPVVLYAIMLVYRYLKR